MREAGFDDEVYRFLLNEVDSVPQMEALLLLWESRPRQWSVEELSDRLYVSPDALRGVLAPLLQRRLLESLSQSTTIYAYYSRSADTDRLMHEAAIAYRRDLVRITTLIHSKASPAVREFARAFRLKKERE